MGFLDDYRFFKNKLKYYTQFVVLFLLIIILGAGQFMFIVYYEKLNGVLIDGAPYLPEYKITYDSITKDLLFAIQGTCLIFAFGLMQITYKKPLISILLIAMCGFFGWQWSKVAEISLNFSVDIMDVFRVVCVEGTIGPSLDSQY
jgi:hypothetical protein